MIVVIKGIESGKDWKDTCMKQFEEVRDGRSIYWPYGLETKMNRVTAGIALRRYSETLPVETEVDLCVKGVDEGEVHYLRLPLTSSKD